MLHHVSFNARHPEQVARGLARLLGARVLQAPVPPFPQDAWFVCVGDEHGTLLEVLPWHHVIDRDHAGWKAHDEQMRERSGTHVLMRTPLDLAQIHAIAAEEGWDASPADAGLFQFTKVWVAGAFLVELMTPEQAETYESAFGAAGMASLDGKLRRLEASIALAMGRR